MNTNPMETKNDNRANKITAMEENKDSRENEITAERFLREEYKLVDFAGLTLNGKPWLEIMDEFAAPLLGAIDSWKKEEEIWHEEFERLKGDSRRLDWLQSVMTPGNNYCEVFFAGLRRGDSDAESFQIESNPEVFPTTNAPTLREAIDAVMLKK